MDTLKTFFSFIRDNSTEGSNLPGSYVRALKYTTELLRSTMPQYAQLEPLWEISSLDKLAEIYKCIKDEEHKKGTSVFETTSIPKSYWKQRFCSSAIRMFARFITESKSVKEAETIFTATDEPNVVASTISKCKVNPLFYLDDDVAANSKEGREVLRNVKARQNQAAFRRIVLLNYGFACCATGLPVRDVLRASHIVGWAENAKTRLLPTNGLCLAATYDAAFDRHLITFDEDCRMILSPSLGEYCTNSAFNTCFKSFEGKRLLPAVKFQPSQEFLAYHRERLVK